MLCGRTREVERISARSATLGRLTVFEGIAKAKVIVLTGAGASVPLGLHTTRQFLEHFSEEGYKRVAISNESDVTLELAQIREATTSGLDIEDVLSLVERRRDAANFLLGDLPFSTQALLGNAESMMAYRDRQRLIADVIYDEVIRPARMCCGRRSNDLSSQQTGQQRGAGSYRTLCGSRDVRPALVLRKYTGFGPCCGTWVLVQRGASHAFR